MTDLADLHHQALAALEQAAELERDAAEARRRAGYLLHDAIRASRTGDTWWPAELGEAEAQRLIRAAYGVTS